MEPRTAAGRALLGHVEPLAKRMLAAGHDAGVTRTYNAEDAAQLRREIAAIEAEAAAPYRKALEELMAAEAYQRAAHIVDAARELLAAEVASSDADMRREVGK